MVRSLSPALARIVKPKLEILFTLLIVSPAATEQRQIDVALLLLDAKQGSSNSRLLTSFGVTRPGFKLRLPGCEADALLTEPTHWLSFGNSNTLIYVYICHSPPRCSKLVTGLNLFLECF